jgi:hypothetical protein
VTGCTLAFQVVFTRMMSSVLAYHFSFLAISLALLGTGAGALAIYVWPQRFEGPLEPQLAKWATVYGILLIVVPLILVRLPYHSDQDITIGFAISLGLVCLLGALPALAAGAVVALAIRGYASDVGRVYAWDLVGAGLGALVIVPLLQFPAPALLVALGVVACGAAALFAGPDIRARWRAGATAAVGVVVVAVSTATSLLYLPMFDFPRDSLAADVWHPLSRVQGIPVEGGTSLLFYDRVYAPVPNADDGMPDWKDLKLGPASIGYELTGPGHALVIGGGGGRDIYNALTSDQRVDVIELNSAIVHVVDDSLGELSGSPYTAEGVSTSVGDGRAILAARDTRYDQIHIGFTDTLSANAAQGFALSENNLYTMEAFEEYLDHLKPGGILNVSRLERLVGDEAIRATVLTLAALEKHGVEHPERNIVVIRGTDRLGGGANFPYETILARLTPYTPSELATVRRLARERGNGVAYAPGGPYYGAWADLADAPSWESFCHGYPLDICPPTDNRPFFFNMRRIDGLTHRPAGYHYVVDPYQLLLVTLGILTVLAVAGLLVPLRLSRSGERPKVTSLLYFVAIGLGFLLLESVLIQRFVLFLGFPTYALSVVLFALLVFTGVGSALSSRLVGSRRALTTVLAAAVGLMALAAFTLQPLLRSMIGLPFPARVAVAIVLLAPMGMLLGMPMPLGLARFSALYPRSIAYAWGVNGVASVLASVLGIALAMNFGYAIATLVAASCYAAAGAHAALGRWRAGDGGDEPPPAAVTVSVREVEVDVAEAAPA